MLLLAVIIGGGSVLVVKHALEVAARADIEVEAAFMKWTSRKGVRYESSVRGAYEHPKKPGRVYVFADLKGVRLGGGNVSQWPTSVPLESGWVYFNGEDIAKHNGRYIGLVISLIAEDGSKAGPIYRGRDRAAYLLVGRRIDASDTLMRALGPGISAIVLLSLGAAWLWVRQRTSAISQRVVETSDALAAFGRNEIDIRPTIAKGSCCDELDILNIRISQMMDRIGRLIMGLDRISEQVAHEVKDEMEQLKLSLDADKDRKVIDRLSHTQKLVGDILELVRLESGADTLSEPFDLKNSARKAADLYADAYEDAGLTIEFELGDDTPAEIVGRESLVIRAIADLLNNSLRHMSNEGYVRISLSQSKSIYHLELQDSGGGVADTNIDSLARASRLKGAPNTSGSGLRFVRAVMIRHGGSITLANADDGLIVILCFPKPVRM
jgi:signal transduction histidine kinase